MEHWACTLGHENPIESRVCECGEHRFFDLDLGDTWDDFRYETIDDPVKTKEVLETFIGEPIVSWDLETTGFEYKTDKIHGISIANSEQSFYFTERATNPNLDTLKEVFLNSKYLPAHNAIFDLHFIRNFWGFVPPEEKVVDTMIMSWLLNENRKHKLKELAKTVLKLKGVFPEFGDLQMATKKVLKIRKKDDVSIFDIPLLTLGKYAARDARLTFDLLTVLFHDLEKEGFKDYYFDVEQPFMWVLWEMEENGVFVDRKKSRKMMDELSGELSSLKQTWDEKTGGVNYNSSPQLIDLLYTAKSKGGLGFSAANAKKTKSGKAPSTDKLMLLRLRTRDKTQTIQTLIDIRARDTLVNTYLSNILAKTSDGYPWIHANFNRIGTVTGRLSSSGGLNLQNQPARGELGGQLRYVFVAPEPSFLPNGLAQYSEKWGVIVVDYSQLELRLLAHFSREPKLVQVFLDGGDPHQMTADLIGVSRYIGKTINFAWAYGTGPITLSNTIEEDGNPRPSMGQAKKWLHDFDLAYPTLVRWKKRVIQKASQLGYVRTIAKRRRRLPGINSREWKLKGRAQRQAVNSIIQGSAADVIGLAMINLRGWIHYYEGLLAVQVHDEVVIYSRESAAPQLSKRVQFEMEDVGRVMNLRVPLVAEPGIGDSWAEAK